jgi:hypothetical protein
MRIINSFHPQGAVVGYQLIGVDESVILHLVLDPVIFPLEQGFRKDLLRL